jgi:hypothetical protein
MPELRVEITKRADGRAVLRCTRADGSVTWQRQNERYARFFPFHDLTHFAVETGLGFRQGFYGLLAEGWDITETEGKGARGPLPPETILVEHVAGLFDRERIGGAQPMTAAEFNAQLSSLATERGLAKAPAFTDAQLVAVRARMDQLQARYAELPPDATLALDFDRATL